MLYPYGWKDIQICVQSFLDTSELTVTVQHQSQLSDVTHDPVILMAFHFPSKDDGYLRIMRY